MVLFLNVKPNQKVLVQHRGREIPATVCYKGFLNLVPGEWVGVSLDYPFGDHNGTWRGRRYFSCPDECGLFIHASNIKFMNSCRRRSYNAYRKVNADDSQTDETLFYTEKPPVESRREPRAVDWQYVRRARTAFRDPPASWRESVWAEKRFALSHAVGNHIPAATMLKPETAMKSFQYTSKPIHREYAPLVYNFSSTPTIPHYTMPHQHQLYYMSRSRRWEDSGVRQPRFVSV